MQSAAMLWLLQLSALLLAPAAAKASPCPFIQAMSDDEGDGAAANLQPLEDLSRRLQPSGASFFVDWQGTGDGTTYDLDGSRPSRVYTSRAASIANVPAGYTADVFKSHRSAGVLTYKLYGYEALSMHKLSPAFSLHQGANGVA